MKKSRILLLFSLILLCYHTESAAQRSNIKDYVRIEITPDEVLLVDRMNRRFVRATKEELKGMLPKNAEFSRLEKILMDASLPGGKTELTGKDVGIPSLEKAKVQLYEFSTKEFSMTPTELTAKYRQVPLEELVKMLTALL